MMSPATPHTSPPTMSRSLPAKSRQPTLKLTNPSTPRHILLPVSRPAQFNTSVCSNAIKQALDSYNYANDSRSSRSKHSMGKLTRATRSPTVSLTNLDLSNLMTSSSTSVSGVNFKGSVSPTGSLRGDPFTSSDIPPAPPWVTEHVGNFVIQEDCVELLGFQLYAVEKWPVSLLCCTLICGVQC